MLDAYPRSIQYYRDKHMEAVIIPTCVPHNHDDLVAKIEEIRGFSHHIHIDIDDGILTRELSWPYEGEGKWSRSGESVVPLDRALDKSGDNFLMQLHLMVSEPREIGEFFMRLGASSLILHVESCDGDVDAIRSTVDAWRVRGVREIGLAILLDTPTANLDPLLPSCDFVHVLSVADIGAQGAPFDSRAIDRVKELSVRFPSYPVSVDGGISLTNIASLAHAGASRFSVGSAISTAADPMQAYRQLQEAAQSALQ